MLLTSPKNPLLKEVRKAVSRGGPTDGGYCVAESFHLLEEALRSGVEVGPVLVAASAREAVERHAKGLGTRLTVVEDHAFSAICATETSQGVIALVRPPGWKVEQVFRGKALVVVLDGVQDPGNAGAIVRAAEAFGATGAVFLKGSVNPYNPKAVRASAGSVFRLPLVSGLDADMARACFSEHRAAVYAAAPGGSLLLGDADLTRPCAFIIGSEGRGVSGRLRSAAAELRIPTTGVESLNASMAAGILLYEARRQRTSRA